MEGLIPPPLYVRCIEFMTQEDLSTAQIGEKQKTFSAVYNTAGPYNERPYIETVLQATSAESNFTFPSWEWLQQDIERLVWHQEEPFQSTSIFAQWCVMSKVRERGVKVLLDGQGADELLGGYRPFDQFLSDLLRQAHIAQLLAEVRALYAHSDSPVSPMLVRSLAWQLPARWLGASQALSRQKASGRGDAPCRFCHPVRGTSTA